MMKTKTTLLIGLACAVGLAAPAMGQSFFQSWAPHASIGGAIGGYKILGTTPKDDAPLLALTLDRQAHVFGNYSHALVTFDRVIRPDGTAVLMRRVTHPYNPNIFAYLPESWPGVGTLGTERVLSASGSVMSTRSVILSQYEILRHPIPMDGPAVGTLAFQRDVMPDGSMRYAAVVSEPEPNVALALNGWIQRGERLPGQTFAVASR
jgi:hypothetical protein